MKTEKLENVDANPMNTGNEENPSADLTPSYTMYDVITMPEYQAGELLLDEIKKDVPDIQFINDLFEYSKVYVNWQDSDGYTALMYASSYGHTEIVKLLLERPEIDVNLQDKLQEDEDDIIEGGRTALMYASNCGHVEIVKLLLENSKITVNLQEGDGWTALMLASDYGRTEIVKLLLERPEIDVNLQTEDGYTALMWALDRGHTEVTKLLLQHPNIDVYIKNRFEGNAISLGLKSDDSEILGLFVDFLMKQTKQ